MLVLSRKVGEKLYIGEDIVLTVTMVKGNRVKLGIEAPEHVRVVRGELKPLVQEFEAPAGSDTEFELSAAGDVPGLLEFSLSTDDEPSYFEPAAQ